MTTPIDDPRQRVRDALRALVQDGPPLTPGHEDVWRNLLLDAVGSDHRPLVDLLLFAAARQVPAALPAGPVGGDAWEALHARLALDFASRTFVRIEAARWAVEAWALARGTIGDADLEERRLRLLPTTVTPPAATAPQPRVAAAAPPARAPRAPRTPPRPTGVVGRAAARVLPPGPRWRVAPSAGHTSPRVPPAPLSAGEMARTVAVVVALVAVPALVLLGKGGRDGSRADAVSSSAPAPTGAADRDAPPTPPDTTLLVPQTVQAVDDVVSADDPRPARERGIGGRYRLVVTGLDVVGSPSCEQVARRIAARSVMIETIAHVPGSGTFTFASRRGLTARLGGDGHFETDPAEGLTDGIRWRVRLSGIVVGDSLQAVSESETEGVLRWRDAQSCRTITRLAGHRLPATLAGAAAAP